MAPGAKKSVPLSIAPGVAAVVMALTLAIITGLFYKVADECSADYKHGSPIDIATYLCCNPDKIVSQVGLRAAPSPWSSPPFFVANTPLSRDR